MKFYTTCQGHSGGYIIQNDFVDYFICIQAESYKEAANILLKVTNDYSEYCDCCGERWDSFFDEDDGTYYISNGCDKNLEEINPKDVYPFENFAIIYYANGNKKRLNVKTKEFTDLGKWI